MSTKTSNICPEKPQLADSQLKFFKSSDMTTLACVQLYCCSTTVSAKRVFQAQWLLQLCEHVAEKKPALTDGFTATKTLKQMSQQLVGVILLKLGLCPRH